MSSPQARKAHNALPQSLLRAAIADVKAGMTYVDVCAKHGCSYSWLSQKLAAAKAQARGPRQTYDAKRVEAIDAALRGGKMRLIDICREHGCSYSWLCQRSTMLRTTGSAKTQGAVLAMLKRIDRKLDKALGK